MTRRIVLGAVLAARASSPQALRLSGARMRGGTAKLLTLFRPATGEVRARGVTGASNAVLHPWLKEELTQILAGLPQVTMAEQERPALAWESYLTRRMVSGSVVPAPKPVWLGPED